MQLQLGLDGLQQPEAQLPIVAGQRDREAYPPIFGRGGVACQRADAIERAGLVRGALILLEQAGVGREETSFNALQRRLELLLADCLGEMYR